ncbi:MAG: 3'-5' exonuclease, partial [Eubacteriales bacterium]
MVNKYVAIDLETTGLRAKHDKIIEIGAVKIENGEIIDTYVTFVNPGLQISDFTKNLTNISQEELEGAPYIQEVLDEFLEFVGEYPLLGHQISFDYAFLKKAAVQEGKTFEKVGMDTLSLARMYLQEEKSKKLVDLCKSLGICHNAHRALDDARAAHELYQLLLAKNEQVGQCQPTPLQFQVKREAPASPRNKER